MPGQGGCLDAVAGGSMVCTENVVFRMTMETMAMIFKTTNTTFTTWNYFLYQW